MNLIWECEICERIMPTSAKQAHLDGKKHATAAKNMKLLKRYCTICRVGSIFNRPFANEEQADAHNSSVQHSLLAMVTSQGAAAFNALMERQNYYYCDVCHFVSMESKVMHEEGFRHHHKMVSLQQ